MAIFPPTISLGRLRGAGRKLLPEDNLENLRAYFIGISEKRLNRRELGEFVAITKSIIISYLINTKSNFIHLSARNGLDITDVAIDIMGDLFIQDESGYLVNINSFINILNDSIYEIEGEKLFFAYQSFLRKVSDAYIARVYAELDPTGFKIKRNIKDTLPTENLALRKSIRGAEIYVIGSEDYDKLPYAGFDRLKAVFLSQIGKNHTTRDLLNILYQTVMQLDCRKEILLNDAVLLFKEYYEMGLATVRLEDDIFDINGVLNDYEIIQLKNLILNEIKSKILIDYYAKSKLTEKQSRGLYEAVNDILHDFIAHGGNNLSYYDYLKKYIDIDKSEYNLRYKSKIEYMIKLLKEKCRYYLFSDE